MNAPSNGERPLLRSVDHQQIRVHDVAGAIADFERLGFTLTSRMYHSFGTSNALIMFAADYLELIGDFDKVTDPVWLRAFEASSRHEGLAALAVASRDIEADWLEFKEAGLHPSKPQTFTRPVPLADGRVDLVTCSICAVPRPQTPGMALFACHQHRPDLLWCPEWQGHSNTALGIASVVFVSDHPHEHSRYFNALFGTGRVARLDRTLRIETGSCEISVLPRDQVRERFAGLDLDPAVMSSDIGVALTVRVGSIDVATEVLRTNAVPFIHDANGLVRVPPEFARGVILELSA